MKITFLAFIVSLLFSACTLVNSTNIPGKEVKEFPAFMQGKYELQYPASMQTYMEDYKTLAEIRSNGIAIVNEGEESFIPLEDSLSISKLGKEYFISMGATPALNVFKVVKKGNNLELYGLNAKDGTTAEQLKAYFSHVELLTDLDAESGEINETIQVTIDEKKLKKYYKSDLVLGEPFMLKRIQ
jgi:hypothetical protein